MFLHLGNDQVISSEQVIIILNLQDQTAGQYEKIIAQAQRAKQITNVSQKGKQKALVVCDDRIYISPISSYTLCKRAMNYHREDKA